MQKDPVLACNISLNYDRVDDPSSIRVRRAKILPAIRGKPNCSMITLNDSMASAIPGASVALSALLPLSGLFTVSLPDRDFRLYQLFQ